MKICKSNAFRKFVSAFLALAMMASLGATAAFAAENNTIEVAEEGVSVSVTPGYVVPEDAEMVYEEDFGEEVSTRSSYTSSGHFKVSLQTANRSFDGNNITCYLETYNSAGTNNAYPDVFYVSLYRHHWYGNSLIGRVEVSREGSSTITWTNVGSGTYFFLFDKANDGTTQYLTNVRYYN